MLADQIVVEVVFRCMDVDYRMPFFAFTKGDLHGKSMHHYHALYWRPVNEDCLQFFICFETRFHSHYELLAFCFNKVLFLHVFQLEIDL